MLSCRERFVTSRSGARLFTADWGDPLDPRVPVLGLPGYARTTKDFAHIAERIAPRRLVSLDYRGRGRSDYAADPADYAPPIMADDIRAVMIALGLHRVVVIGTSFGGLMAMALAVMAPTALAGVVLNDIGPEIPDTGGDFLIEVMGRERRPASWEAAAAEMKTILPDMSFTTQEEWVAFAKTTYREEPDGSLRQDWDPAIVKPLAGAEATEADLWALFSALTAVPVLLVRGGRSIVLSAETASEMQRRHPAMETVLLPEIGHAPTLDEPPAREALERFLGRH
ncbi:alpha/beta hydrolase [Thalassobaculum sp. OXR-137]|uniref:alpha/beta fold hydrolase n=1 Tax=Thalassobaculum sp. OXR-137 TaxID=3100173 RepID=UPI002AC8C1BD|nr:alpha/beta hydrolase [Thalassobaculum sp. OXR-137]WPZ33023.1 alpha/beta hydrolase [Thalassobaculum sp. OXR-137]